MPRFSYEDRDDKNLRRLQQFEAAESRSAMDAVRRERLDIAHDKLAFDHAQKLVDSDRKLAESTARMTAAQDRSAILEQQLQLQRDAQQIREQKQLLQESDSLRKAADIKGFLQATRGLKESQEDFEDVVENAMIQFPNALQDEFIQKRMGWLTTSRNEFKQRTRARNEALANRMQPTKATVDGVTYEAKEEKAETPDTYERFNKDLEEAKKAYTTGPLPSFLQKYFEDRGRKLEQPHRDAEKAGAPAGAKAEPVAPPKIASAQDFDSLPSGAEFIDPQGVKRRKP